MAHSTRWWKQEEASGKKDANHQLASAVFERAAAIDQDGGETRRTNNLRYISLYENRELSITVDSMNIPGLQHAGLTFNVCSSCVDALASKVLTNKPKPMYLTTDGDFSAQMRAKKRQRWTMGTFQATKLYEKAVDGGLDAKICDIGTIKWFPEDGRVACERVFPNELLVDQRAAAHGAPRELLQRKYVPTDVMINRFPDFEVQIEASASQKSDQDSRGLIDDEVEVIEAWHLPSGPKASDGRHVIAVKGAVLFDEKWKDDTFPFSFIRWTKLRQGFFGQGLVEQLDGIQTEITDLAQKISKAHRLLGIPWVKKPGGCTIKTGGITNDIGEIMEYDGNEPKVEVHAVLAPEVYQYLEQLFNKAFECSGLSQLSATSRKPAGIESGVALRTLLDTETQRFALWVETWQEFILDNARQAWKCAKRIGGAKAMWRQKEWAREITWKDAGGDEEDEERYVLQLWPTNLLPDTPTGKLAYVEQMITAGLINPEQGQALLDYPDIEAFQRQQLASRDLFEQIVEHLLEGGAYEDVVPTKEMNLQLGITMVQGSLLRAKINKWPDERTQVLARWLNDASAIPQMAAQQAAPVGATPPGQTPSPLPPVGMPPPTGAPAPGPQGQPAAPMAA